MRPWLCSAVMLAGAMGGARAAEVVDLDLAPRIGRPSPENKFELPDFYVWCGSMVAGEDGKYHLFYSRWPRSLGHLAWVTHSEVAHAVADKPAGPYRHVDVALPERGPEFWDGHCTHNPTVIRSHTDGKYYLYYMGNHGDRQPTKGLNFVHRNNQRIGVAVADTPAGPWRRFDRPLIDVTPGGPDALCTTNPSVAQGPGKDGKFVMVYKGVGTTTPGVFGGPVLLLSAASDSPTGPFKKHAEPVFTKPGVNFAAEDPFVFWYGGAYRAVVKDNGGHFTPNGKSLILFDSTDGEHWKLAPHPLVSRTQVTWADGREQKLNSLERPQLWLGKDGEPAVLFCAVDEDKGRTHSFNLAIPIRAKE